MDYRSDGSRYLQAQFIRGRMQPLHQEGKQWARTVGFANLDTKQQFLWTSSRRIVRLDPTEAGVPTFLNILQQDGMDFEPVDHLYPGETVRRDLSMKKLDLVPSRTSAQGVRDVTLRYGLLIIGGAAAGFALKIVAGIVIGTAVKTCANHYFSAIGDAEAETGLLHPSKEDLAHAHQAAQAFSIEPDPSLHQSPLRIADREWETYNVGSHENIGVIDYAFIGGTTLAGAAAGALVTKEVVVPEAVRFFEAPDDEVEETVRLERANRMAPLVRPLHQVKKDVASASDSVKGPMRNLFFG